MKWVIKALVIVSHGAGLSNTRPVHYIRELARTSHGLVDIQYLSPLLIEYKTCGRLCICIAGHAAISKMHQPWLDIVGILH